MTAERACQICTINPSKYNCPKCAIKSCSLACSRKHKEAMQCDGKREKNNFIKRKEMNLKTVFSDSLFLQEIRSSVACGTIVGRGRVQEKHHHQGAINNLKQIVKHASLNNCAVKIAPVGLKRARSNQSKFLKKRKEISWTIEWQFLDENEQLEGKRETILTHRNLETEILGNLLKNSQPRSFNSSTTLFAYIKNTLYTQSGSNNSSSYFLLDLSSTLRSNLIACQVIEFPTFLVSRSPLESSQISEKPILDHYAQTSDLLFEG